jgi:HKD family nuclease
LFDLLAEHRDKIEQLTVGVHFYQTHPDFIAEFLDHDGVRFVMNPSGVFHPKLYMFELPKGRWECVTGSANFTKAAFTSNAEVAVHFTEEDHNAPAVRAA